jgi:hypothetical protein
MAERQEPRFTLEQVRAGLLSDEACAKGAEALTHREATRAEVVEVRYEIEAALDHFIQQPAGVGADADSESSTGSPRSDARVFSGENVSADSDGNQQPQGGGGWRTDAEEALALFHDHGDYEAPISVLEKLLKGGEADAPEDLRETRRSVAEGDSVQCGGVALAQLREIAEVAARAAFVPPITEDRIADMETALRTVPLIQAVAACREIATYNADELREWEEENAADMVDIARAALTQQSSGGQEEGVTQKDFDRAEQLIAEGKIPGGQEGEVEEGAEEGAVELIRSMANFKERLCVCARAGTVVRDHAKPTPYPVDGCLVGAVQGVDDEGFWLAGFTFLTYVKWSDVRSASLRNTAPDPCPHCGASTQPISDYKSEGR